MAGWQQIKSFTRKRLSAPGQMGREASEETTSASGCRGLGRHGVGLVCSLSHVLAGMSFTSPHTGRGLQESHTLKESCQHLPEPSLVLASGSVLLAGHLQVCEPDGGEESQ